MAEEEFEIRMKATGADPAAKEVQKVGGSMEGLGKQSEGADKLVQQLNEELEKATGLMEEMTEAAEELADAEELVTEATEDQTAARRKQATEDVETVRNQKNVAAAQKEMNLQLSSGNLAKGALGLRLVSERVKALGNDLRVVAPETAANLQRITDGMDDVTESVGTVAAGFSAGGPWGAVAGAVVAAGNIVVKEIGKINAALAKEIALQKELDEATRDYVQTLIDRDNEARKASVLAALDEEIAKTQFLNDALDVAARRTAIRRQGDAAVQSAGAREQLALIDASGASEQEKEIQRRALEQADFFFQAQQEQTQLAEQVTLLTKKRVNAQEVMLAAEEKETAARLEAAKLAEQRAAAEEQAEALRQAFREAEATAEGGRLVNGRQSGPDSGPLNALRARVQRKSGPFSNAQGSADITAALEQLRADEEAAKGQLEQLTSVAEGLRQQFNELNNAQILANDQLVQEQRVFQAEKAAEQAEAFKELNEDFTATAAEVLSKGQEFAGQFGVQFDHSLNELFKLMNDGVADSLQAGQINQQVGLIITQLRAYGSESLAAFKELHDDLRAMTDALKTERERRASNHVSSF